jgi:hypothetical protein
VGRSADPRRAAEARVRSRGVNSFEVHDRAPWTAIAEWRTFLRNHADAIAAIDLCVVPTLTFERRNRECSNAYQGNFFKEQGIFTRDT